jgi:hypothetical protein
MTILNDKSQSPSLSETRKFGFILIVGSLIAGSVWTGLIYLLRDEWKIVILYYFLAIGGSIALLCIAFPKPLQPFHRGWLWVTKFLERVATYALLTTFYYLILTPAALCLRLFGHKPFIKRGNKDSDSYWEPVKAEPKSERYYRQY